MLENSLDIMKKANIFVIWGNFPPAISSSRGYRIYKELADRGHEIKVFVGKLPGTSFYEQISENLELYRIPPSFHYPLRKGILVRVLYTLTILIRYFVLFPLLVYSYLRKKTDVIIVEGTSWELSPKIMKFLKINTVAMSPWVLFKKIFKIPTIIYFTNIWCADDIQVQVESRYADRIIIVDKWMEKKLRDFGINRKIFYIPVSIDTNKFSPIYNPESRNVIFVGRLAVDKAPDILIKAIPKVIKEVSDVKFKIVGEGDEEHNLKSLVDKLNLNKYVDFIGPVSADEIRKFHADARVLVNPVRSPGISNVVIEAIASGIPIIKSKYAEYEEDIVIDGKNGYSFEVDNHNDLARKLIMILKDDKAKLEDMSKNARKTAINYDMQVILDKFEDAILTVAS